MKRIILIMMFLIGLGTSSGTFAQAKLDVFNDAPCSVNFIFTEETACSTYVASIPAGPGKTQRYGNGGAGNFVFSVTVTATGGGFNLTVEDCSVTSCSCGGTNLSGSVGICSGTYTVDFTPATATVNASVWIH